jgi:tetratricopeptide (TPR) repeat protein
MKNLRESGYFEILSSFVLLAFFSVFVIFASFSSPVQAQQTDIDKLLEEGKKAYLDGDYERAIQLLNQAILLIKNKSTLIDAHLSLALTYFTVNQIENCKEQIKSILKLNPSFKPDPEFYSPKFIKVFDDVRKENTREALINTVPVGATIFIDDENKGLTPFRGALYTGKHRLKVVKEGYEPVEKEIVIEKMKENVFELTLNPLAPAEEKPVEKKEEVKPVEKKPVEEKPVEEVPVAKEKVEKPEKKKSYTALYILAGLAVAGVAVALLLGKKKEEGKGSIDVKSDPTGARIFLDGADTGKVTNAVLTDVKVGTHSITLRKDRYREYSTSVSVSKNQTSTVNAKLEPGAFTENFDDNVADYWVDDGTGRWRAYGSAYRMDGKGRGDEAFTYYDIGPYTNFTLELYIAALMTSGSYHGVRFRSTDKTFKNCYSVDLSVFGSGAGYYSVWKAVGSSWSIIKNWTQHSAIKPYNNWNKLKIVCSGSTTTIYINDVSVYSFSDSSYTSGYFGLEALDDYTSDKIIVDNLSLTLSTAGASTNPEQVFPVLVPGKIRVINPENR